MKNKFIYLLSLDSVQPSRIDAYVDIHTLELGRSSLQIITKCD